MSTTDLLPIIAGAVAVVAGLGTSLYVSRKMREKLAEIDGGAERRRLMIALASERALSKTLRPLLEESEKSRTAEEHQRLVQIVERVLENERDLKSLPASMRRRVREAERTADEERESDVEHAAAP